MSLQEVENVIDSHSGLSRVVLEYSRVVKRVVDSAQKPGFSVESWAPLAELVDTDAFERMGNFKEVMDWQAYVRFLTDWAPSASWECSFKRITEAGRVVFLELEERTEIGDFRTAVNSLSVYEFNDADKIVHVDIYLQMEPPGSEMMQTYEGVDMPGRA